MARNIYSRLHLCGTLVTQSPLHVGGYGEEVDTDLPLARDGAGQLYIPGTSLAGALRELAERLFGESVIDELWGYQREDRGHASFVVVEDAEIENSDKVVVEIRDHVGIDREYGAAAEHIKYDRAILPRGTKITLGVSVDVAKQEKRDQTLAMLAALQQALKDGEVRLGAAKTRGLGHVRLDGGRLTEQVFGSRRGILASLRQANGTVVTQTDIATAQQAFPTQNRPRLTLMIHWKPVGPLMVKAGFDGIAADMLPMVSGCDGQVSVVLPGSSVKGALRSQAEGIVRTVCAKTCSSWLGGQGRQKFLDAVKLPLINELFGAAKHSEGNPHLGIGALGVMDCFGQHRLTVEQWQAIQAATDDRQLRQALNAAGLPPWSQAYHVAIDRWLGSVADGALYSVLEPHCTKWDPLRLEVNLPRLPSDLQLPAMALLLLVIRDLANDRLPLGFATHRGMGTVSVEQVEVVGVDLPEPLAQFGHVVLSGGRLTELPADLRQAMNRAWQQWIADNQDVPA
uniref:CRISPR type III-associated protein domain-containing protein n=1 Tax=Schlesneria paludicola TaxID=360056 RepID=A0A7C4LNP0_9PLAN